MQPIVSPSFASWQASRGIVPWTVAHGFRHLRAFLAECFDRILEAMRAIVAAFESFAARVVEAVTAVGRLLGAASGPSAPPARPALAHKLNIRALPPLPPRVFHVEHRPRRR